MEERESPTRVAAATGWWIVQLLVAVPAYAHKFLSQLSVASCTATACENSLYSLTMNTFNVGAMALLAATTVGIFLLRRSGFAVWSPIVGILATIALLFVTYALSRAALDLPLFGNRLS